MELIKEKPAAENSYKGFQILLTAHLGSQQTTPDLLGLVRLQRSMETLVSSVTALPETETWATELREQVEDWTQNRKRYLSWIEILAEKSEEELAPLGAPFISVVRHDLKEAPSLSALAGGQIGSIELLKGFGEKSAANSTPLSAWMDRVMEAFARAQWLAGETLGQVKRLTAEVAELSAKMKMDFLYDTGRKLFAIGYNVSTSRLDTSRYDLLASEARFGSFVAIARGDVPLEHWFALGRLYSRVGLKRILLSWTGTMFEYLMPLLFLRSYPHSLLDKAAREAVSIQVAFGHKHGVPWGISESAYANLDQNNTYQYKAFGVPALSLKGGSENQLVVAPYAALLALNIAPGETVKNLKRMVEIGLLGDYGYYESVDFSRQTQRYGGRGLVVEAYMAHHQGMAFLALSNFLHKDSFCRRFHRDPRVRAFEALLQERIPSLPPLHLTPARHRASALLGDDVVSAGNHIAISPRTRIPRSLLLGNGTFSLMITNNGGGYSQWRNLELTRWRSDQISDAMGTFFYLYEPKNDHLWSVSSSPVGTAAEDYSVEFTLDRAVFRHVNKGLHSEMEVIVSQEDDVELRRITLVNRSSSERTLDLTSYAELSMAPHKADHQHPAFNKLFIQTEALQEQRTLLAYRRARSSGDLPVVVAHRLQLDNNGDNFISPTDWQFETDRKRFIGRGHTLANPMGARQDLGGSEGFVLDPVLSVKQRITLKPGRRSQITLLFAVAETREAVLRLVDKYSDPQYYRESSCFCLAFSAAGVAGAASPGR